MNRIFLSLVLISALSANTSKADLVQVFGPNDSASGVGSADSLFNSIVQRPSDNAFAVGQAKYRGASNNFNMSFDNGAGTNVGTSINQTVTPRTSQLFSFSEQHYYSNTGGPNGFVFQMRQVQGDLVNGPTLIGGNPIPVAGSTLYTEAWGTGFTTAQVPVNGGLNSTSTATTLAGISVGDSFNAIHFEARGALAGTYTQVWNLSYTLPNSFTVLNPSNFSSALLATPTSGLPGNTTYQHEWLVTDQDLSKLNWSIQGVVAITGATNGGESDKFTVSAKQLSYMPVVSEPSTVALFGLGIVGLGGYSYRQRRPAPKA